MRDMIAKGRDRHEKGEKSSRALLSAQHVLDIRESAEPYTKLAEKYGVSPSTIASAASGANWRHVGGRRRRRYLTKEQVRAIRVSHSEGARGKDLATRFDVTQGLISGIVNGKVWKNV